eukprot:873337-Pelagomonas_calceolata.AAC.3
MGKPWKLDDTGQNLGLPWVEKYTFPVLKPLKARVLCSEINHPWFACGTSSMNAMGPDIISVASAEDRQDLAQRLDALVGESTGCGHVASHRHATK